MLDFDTQEQVLNYLGKKNDRNLIKRMIRDGRLHKEDGRYYLEEASNFNDLRFISKAMGEKVLAHGEIIKLEEEVARLREENEKLKEKSEFNPDELEEAKVQWKYYEDLAESRRALMEKIIHETYVIVKAKLGNKMEDESEFRGAIIRKAKNID